ncbi:LuxR C-terminal-related transcriptional regulator [Streptomyces sp. NPDC004752]
MTTTTAAKISLARREQQVLQGMAAGNPLGAVAGELRIREGTAAGYLKQAKNKLHGVSVTAAAVAVGYATGAIAQPPLLNLASLSVPRAQCDLVSLIARGLTTAQMAADLKQPVNVVRADGRALLTVLGARNRAHLITRAWQFRILSADQVIA